MKYSVYHPEGFHMCDIEIRADDSAFNKAQVNDPNSETFNPSLPKWVPQCPHPPERLYTWTAFDGSLCVACCDCGEVLKGGA